MRKSIAIIAALALLPMLAAQAKDKPAAAQAKDKPVAVSTTFTTDANTKIRVGDKKTATLADIKVGDKVHITYHDNAGTHVADHVAVMGEKKGGKPAEKPAGAEPKKHEPKPGELHAGGAVTAVDATAVTPLGATIIRWRGSCRCSSGRWASTGCISARSAPASCGCSPVACSESAGCMTSARSTGRSTSGTTIPGFGDSEEPPSGVLKSVKIGKRGFC